MVGSSDTGVSCIEALLTGPGHRGTAFSGLTLLSPFGPALPSAGAGGAARLAGLGLTGGSGRDVAGVGCGGGGAAAVQVVTGTLVVVDRERQVVVLADGRELPFDVLVLATGLEDPLLAPLAAACSGHPQLLLTPYDVSSLVVAGTASAVLGSGVLLVGAGLEAYGSVAELMDCGVAAGALGVRLCASGW